MSTALQLSLDQGIVIGSTDGEAGLTVGHRAGKRPSSHDVERRAVVSQATVSHVVDGLHLNYRKMDKETADFRQQRKCPLQTSACRPKPNIDTAGESRICCPFSEVSKGREAFHGVPHCQRQGS